MTDGAKTKADIPRLTVPSDDERSTIRPRVEATPEGAPQTVPPPRRRLSSSPTISLNERINQKLRLAASLLENLTPDDPHARLVHIALLRRDETLLDGVIGALSNVETRSPRTNR